MSEIKKKIREEINRRLDIYLDTVSESEMIDDGGYSPVWLVLCDLFDHVANGARMTYKVAIKEGKVVSVTHDDVIANPEHRRHKLSSVLDDMKKML